MQEYSGKKDLIAEISKTADMFIREFEDIREADRDIRFQEADRTPRKIIAYQLGWMNLLLQWNHDELEEGNVTGQVEVRTQQPLETSGFSKLPELE